MNTSFSALNTFQTCPLKYKYSAIDKIKPLKKSPEAVFGSVVHSAMQFAHSGSFVLPTQKETLNHFTQKWNSDVFENEFQERAAFAQGIKIIQNYYKHNNPADFQIVDLESRFSVDLKEKDDTHLISGIIDRIDKTEDGYEIIDYKTANKLPSQNHAKENLQLLIYLLAFIKRYPELAKNPEKVKLSLYYLKHGTKLSTTKTKEQLEKEREKIFDLFNQIKNSDFKPQTSPLCDWCDYQKICPMWKHKFKEEFSISDKEKQSIAEKYVELLDKSKEIRGKIKALQENILDIMQNEESERLFVAGKIISKTQRQTFKYDENKLQKLLKEKNLWEKVVKINQTQLNKVINVLSPEEKQEIEKFKELKSESFGITVKKEL